MLAFSRLIILEFICLHTINFSKLLDLPRAVRESETLAPASLRSSSPRSSFPFGPSFFLLPLPRRNPYRAGPAHRPRPSPRPHRPPRRPRRARSTSSSGARRAPVRVGRGGGVFFGISGFVFPTALAGGRRVGRPLRLACELDQLARDGFRRGRGRRKDDGPNGNEEREETKKPDGWSERLADGMNAFFPTLWEDPKLC